MKPITSMLAAISLAAAAAGGGVLAAEPAPVAAPAPPLPYGTPITLEQARAVVAAAEAEAKKRGVAISVAVVDTGGYMVLAERMTGVSEASSETVFLKAKSAVIWQRPTSTWLPAIAASNGAQLNYPHVWPGAGGEVVVAGGRTIGGVGVGGGAAEGEIAKIAAAALR
ncbi:MAG TPA: heme-binding protein [Caulobacteraceae bacterium]|jgi:uncharacterized protein GlcG (DUF336 family)|nr:heme-binding protein [Caulobacteraceae bacterium]